MKEHKLFLLGALIVSYFYIDNVSSMPPTFTTFFGRPNEDGIFPPSCGFRAVPCAVNNHYRRADASCSNPFRPEAGVPGDNYIYLLPPMYQDGLSAPKTAVRGKPLPPARQVKNAFFDDGDVPSPDWNLLTMSWGQFFAHDISLLMENRDEPRCCSDDRKIQENMAPSCMPLQVANDDPKMSSEGVECLNFTRAGSDVSMGCCMGVAEPINTVTAFLDLSPTYGNNARSSRRLRTGQGGLMRTETRNGKEYLPSGPSDFPGCSVAYETGDRRVNQNLPLTAVHTIYVREHNYLARRLLALNPHWDDETVYQETRKIMIAQYQYINYYEWLPIFLGRSVMLEAGLIFETNGHVEDFVPSLTPAPSNEYAHAAFRYFHTNIPDGFELRNEDRSLISTMPFGDNFFCQDIMTTPGIMEQINVGMTAQPMGEFDNIHAPSITQRFGVRPMQTTGSDVRSIDIQRGRDVALPPYSAYRQYCNVGGFSDFSDFSDYISEEDVSKLTRLYPSHDAVDLSVGGSLERHVRDAHVGPTFLCILVEQFLRTRRADSKWFEHRDAGFTPRQLVAIKETSTMARLLCNSAEGITRIQRRAFALIDEEKNPLVPCSSIPELDLAPWKEDC